MNRNQLQRVAPRGAVGMRPTAPMGAPMGGFAGYQQGYPQQGMVPYVPQGADEGALAGCGNPGFGYAGPGACGVSPFAGLPNILAAGCYRQPCALLGITVTPTSAGSTTLEISCGSSMFYGYCGRSFNSALTYGLTSIISSGDYNRLCSDGGMVDVAYFDTTDCCCPFDFGCFNNSQPLFMTFQPITATSVLVPFSFVIGGEKLVNFGCPPYPCFPWPGGGGGGYQPPPVGGGGQLGYLPGPGGGGSSVP